MKKKGIGILVAAIVVVVLGGLAYKKAEDVLACRYVKEFLQLSYNCGAEEIEEVLEKQSGYYEVTMRQMCEENPPIDAEYVKEMEQEMQVVSDIDTTVEKNVVGNQVVHAAFIVQFKDIYEPEGFTEVIKLSFTLVKTGMFRYQISDIR